MSGGRVEPLASEDLDPGQRAFLAPFTDTRGRYPNIFGVLCRNLPLMEAWRDFGLYLMTGSRVDPVLREILILRTSHHQDCAYEWHHHSRIATAQGIDDARLARIREGGPMGDPDQDLMIRCADELARDGRLSDQAWTDMTARFGLEYTMDAVFTVGAYTALAMGLNSCGVQIEGRPAQGSANDDDRARPR